MIRRAPKTGYDSIPDKQQYRRLVWNTFRKTVPNGSIACMPSIEGTEVEVAISRGYRPDQLHVIDDNPAIVAHLARRYPGICTHGVRVSQARHRLEEEGGVSAINLDFTGCVGPPVTDEILALGNSGALRPRAIVAVTLLRGRETHRRIQKGFAQLNTDDDLQRGAVRSLASLRDKQMQGDYLNQKDILRLNYAMTMLWRVYRFLRVGTYLSGTQSLVWGIAETVTPKYFSAVIDRRPTNAANAAHHYRVMSEWLATDIEEQRRDHEKCFEAGYHVAECPDPDERDVE